MNKFKLNERVFVSFLGQYGIVTGFYSAAGKPYKYSVATENSDMVVRDASEMDLEKVEPEMKEHPFVEMVAEELHKIDLKKAEEIATLELRGKNFQDIPRASQAIDSDYMYSLRYLWNNLELDTSCRHPIYDNPVVRIPDSLEFIPLNITIGGECEHVWMTYDSGFSRWEYCDKCDVKK